MGRRDKAKNGVDWMGFETILGLEFFGGIFGEGV
jgi:hypothetical protein